jgi:histidinol phosphatase-like enzyme
MVYNACSKLEFYFSLINYAIGDKNNDFKLENNIGVKSILEFKK